MRGRVSPLGAVIRGAAAGAAGTLAMDAVWYLRYRGGGGTQSFTAWEFSSGLSSWDGAPAPALIGKRLYEALFQRELSPRRVGLTNNVTHWGTGIAWGAQYGVLVGSVANPRTRALASSALGPTAWAASYVVLPLAKVYQPIWEYGVRTLAKDLSAHMAYGSVTSAVFRLLGGAPSGIAPKTERA